MYSLRFRLFIIASIILAVSFIAMALILENAYKHSTLSIQFSRLENVLQDLITLADPYTEKENVIVNTDIDNRLRRPLSGLYAQVSDINGKLIWRSSSTLGQALPFDNHLQQGEKKFYQILFNKNEPLFAMSYLVNWKESNEKKKLIFTVAENKYYFNKQLAEFSVALWDSFITFILLLVIVLILILNWGFYPIKKLTKEMKKVEEGENKYLTNSYPKELSYLKHNINHFIEHEVKRRTRYVNAIADLAHSMKTPLAILRNLKRSSIQKVTVAQVIDEQLERLEQILRYQLQRAATSGAAIFPRPISIFQIINKILKALKKVYMDKDIKIDNLTPSHLMFYGEELDLLEVLGNCLDNAFKWCHNRVCITAYSIKSNKKQKVRIVIKDNGPGFHTETIYDFKKRGIRADESKPGQGLGLSMATEIVEIYGGQLLLSNIQPNGAKVTIIFNKT